MKIQRSQNRNGNVKVCAVVPSATRGDVMHRVVYIRSKNFRGCICTCENFLFDKLAKGRNCIHIKQLRQQYGRYFTAVPR